MIRFFDRGSPVKSIPGRIEARADGIRVHAQTIRLRAEVFDVVETFAPIAWPGEPARYRIVLTKAGLVLEEQLLSEPPVSTPGEVFYLAALTLRAAEDTPETVDVEVPRITHAPKADAEPAPDVPIAITGLALAPAETPERAAKKARTKADRQALRALAGKPEAEWTDAEMRAGLAALLRAQGHEAPETQPKDRRK